MEKALRQGERVGTERCDVCNGELSLKETKSISGTEYQMLQCNKCRKIIARHKT